MSDSGLCLAGKLTIALVDSRMGNKTYKILNGAPCTWLLLSQQFCCCRLPSLWLAG